MIGQGASEVFQGGWRDHDDFPQTFHRVFPDFFDHLCVTFQEDGYALVPIPGGTLARRSFVGPRPSCGQGNLRPIIEQNDVGLPLANDFLQPVSALFGFSKVGTGIIEYGVSAPA